MKELINQIALPVGWITLIVGSLCLVGGLYFYIGALFEDIRDWRRYKQLYKILKEDIKKLKEHKK